MLRYDCVSFAGDSPYVGGHVMLAVGVLNSDIVVMCCFESLLAGGLESGDTSKRADP